MMKGKPMIERSREPLFDDAPRPDAPVSGEPPRRSVLEASARLSRLVRLGTLGFGRPYWRGTIYSASSGALRMKIAAACVPAFRDDFAIAHEHGAYERVGVRESRAAARELNGSAHVFDIGFAVCHDCLLLMPRIRAFAEGRSLRFAISDMRVLMPHDAEIDGRSTRVGPERMGDGCPVALGSRKSKLPKSRQCKKP